MKYKIFIYYNGKISEPLNLEIVPNQNDIIRLFGTSLRILGRSFILLDGSIDYINLYTEQAT